MDTIGVVVNPIAGMGGRVGLKGTDGKLAEARRRGATPRAPDRATEALDALFQRRPDLTVYTAAGEMGADQARAVGYEPTVVYDPEVDSRGDTTADDTRAAVEAFLERGVDLVLFVGGDGTAVDVAEVLTAYEDESEGENDNESGEESKRTPMLGVPAGVKVYSSVFGVSPTEAGRIAAEFERVEPREVNDIDEAAYREGEVRAELKAVVPVPVAEQLQASKQLASGSVDSLARGFAREIEPGTTYVFGPGSTVGAIESELGIDASPLGVDVWRARSTEETNADDWHGYLLARDASESEILEVLAEPIVIVVSPIGGQGFVFGRGNHQISPAVIDRARDVEIVASDEKLDGLDSLRVDTDDERIDDSLRGWQKVRTGRFTTRLVQIV
ncbi:ATP-NAD kinase family protein [Natronoglomus mannanivorans]|uniref:ATP-NAD kinase family protein n=1 Tax=Natronoglomus mannanivorans TaxID=2979990 RepID=A0AAP2YZJ9_9EURY|nr:ATP-NAD kinase family protein [Halobacteria archaeon AArc-xg1-1]